MKQYQPTTNKEVLDRVLLALIGSEELVNRWWESQNYAFGLQRPVDLWNTGEKGKRQVAEYIIDQVMR